MRSQVFKPPKAHTHKEGGNQISENTNKKHTHTHPSTQSEENITNIQGERNTYTPLQESTSSMWDTIKTYQKEK